MLRRTFSSVRVSTALLVSVCAALRVSAPSTSPPRTFFYSAMAGSKQVAHVFGLMQQPPAAQPCWYVLSLDEKASAGHRDMEVVVGDFMRLVRYRIQL